MASIKLYIYVSDHPLITPMSDVVVVEGNNTVLVCSATSNPASTFKWYKKDQDKTLHQGNGTLDNNELIYYIQNIRRSDAGTYTCNARNGIGKAANKDVLLTVYCKCILCYCDYSL